MSDPPDALQRLRRVLEGIGSVVVAFSGGVDSALVAWAAHDTLGADRALSVTALSPSLAPEEEQHCRALAQEWGLRWSTVVTNELGDRGYVANGPDRCARCKSALMEALGPLAEEASATVVLGVNTDDLADYRPGQRAASARGARFPLVEAGLSKAEVRRVSRRLGLRTWDKPAAPCLASRLAYGTPVTIERLNAVAAAESALRAIGAVEVRVRHHGEVARIEVPPDRLAWVLERRKEVVDAVQRAGFRFVALDLEGFRSGSLNRVLRPQRMLAP